MKKIASILLLFTVLLTSCSDDDPDFDTIGTTFEVDNVDFNQSDILFRFTFPDPIFDSDGVLVYRLEAIDNGLEVWEPLPTSTYFLDNGGEVFYRFNYTSSDVDIFLESPDFNLVTDNFTQNQVFRIIIVPSAFASDTTIDISNIDAVLSKLNITTDQIQTIQL